MPSIRQYIAPETACLIEQTDLHTGEVTTFTVYRTYIDDDFTQPSPNPDLAPRQVIQGAVDRGWVELDGISFWTLVDGKPGPWEVDAVAR